MTRDGDADPLAGVPVLVFPRGAEAPAVNAEGAAIPTMGLFRGEPPAEP
jgi:hypothetical protein